MLIIQHYPKQIVTTPCPKQASVRLPHRSVEGRFLPPPGGTVKHLGRREEGDSCGPLSPGRGMCSRRETESLVCIPLWWEVRKTHAGLSSVGAQGTPNLFFFPNLLLPITLPCQNIKCNLYFSRFAGDTS